MGQEWPVGAPHAPKGLVLLRLICPSSTHRVLKGLWHGTVQTLYPTIVSQANGVLRKKESLATVTRHSKMLWREAGLEFLITYELSHPLSSYHGPWGTEWASGYSCHVNSSLTSIRKDQPSVVKRSLTKLSNLVESLTSFQITWVVLTHSHYFHENSSWWWALTLKVTQPQINKTTFSALNWCPLALINETIPTEFSQPKEKKIEVFLKMT